METDKKASVKIHKKETFDFIILKFCKLFAKKTIVMLKITFRNRDRVEISSPFQFSFVNIDPCLE